MVAILLERAHACAAVYSSPEHIQRSSSFGHFPAEYKEEVANLFDSTKTENVNDLQPTVTLDPSEEADV